MTPNKMETIHKTVLLNEAIEGLDLKKGAVVVDGTFGGGGHTLETCKRFPDVKIIAIDQDKGAFKKAKHKFENLKCDVTFVNENFRNLDKVLQNENVNAVDGVILDLGLSSDQLENSGRGFSFLKNEPLLMTMKENPEDADVTATDVVNTWSEENLADIIYGYGEEKFSRKIAKGIVDARQKSKIETTFDLVKIIESAVPGGYKRGRLHFATRTFQAIRIAVNDELEAVREGIDKGFDALKVGGRMSVITFHSLEDRIVKKFYKAMEVDGHAKLVNKKIILASDEELKKNPRSRSAKLRIIQKTQ